MPEKKIKLPFPDPTTGGVTVYDGVEVQVNESTERWSEITLEDGTVIRVKPAVLSAVRIEGRFDNEGNPIYALKGGQTVAVISVPAHLKKGAAGKVQ